MVDTSMAGISASSTSLRLAAERRAEEGIQRHRAQRDRSLGRDEARDNCGALAQRADTPRRHTEEQERTPRPASQRRPARRGCRAYRLLRAGARAYLRRTRALVRPQRQRPRDRCERVPISPADTAWQNHQNRTARPASIPPSNDPCQRGLLTGSNRTLDRTRSQTVPHDHKRSPWLPAHRLARSAARRPRRLARWRPCGPGLDLDGTMNDPSLASRLLQRSRGARRVAVLQHRPATFFSPATRRCSVSCRPSTTLPADPAINRRPRWTSSPARPQTHHPARTNLTSDPSTTARANS